jgi:hypothetical protein
MSSFWGYVILSAVVPVGLPLVVAGIYASIKKVRFQLHLLFGGGQLCFYSITLSLVNLSQLKAVKGHESIKGWADAGLYVIAVVAACVWGIGIGETLSPGSSGSDDTKRGITRYSIYVAVAAIILGGWLRWKAGLFS